MSGKKESTQSPRKCKVIKFYHKRHSHIFSSNIWTVCHKEKLLFCSQIREHGRLSTFPGDLKGSNANMTKVSQSGDFIYFSRIRPQFVAIPPIFIPVRHLHQHILVHSLYIARDNGFTLPPAHIPNYEPIID